MLPTPFNGQGELWLQDVPRLVESQLAAGVHGIAALGLGGEAGLLTLEERRSVAECVLQSVAGQAPVVVGVSSNSRADSIALAAHAVGQGAAAVMVAPPATGIASPGDVFDFFQAVAVAVATAAPAAAIMIQDAPQYIGTEVGPAVLQRVAAELPNARYFKTEALPAGDAVVKLREALGRAPVNVFGGQAGVNLIDALEAGATGAIPGCEVSRLLVEVWNQHQLLNQPLLARELFKAVLPMLVFEMQTLEHFILCTKLALFRKGLLSGPRTRLAAQLSPLSVTILDRHLAKLAELESQFC
jgi:dihydrodipicolinate synthase/N-acetylneuraminate lyase